MSVPSIQIPNPIHTGDYDHDPGISPHAAALASGFPATLTVKLGRIAPKARPHVLRLAAFLEAPTAPPPAATSWRTKARDSILRMYLNDRFGDCVIASKYHLIGLWTGNDTPSCVTVADAEVQKVYFHFSPNDQGCVVTEVLDYWRSTGLPVNGTPHKIDGYVAVDWRNKLEVQTALVLFGGLTLAIDLPAEWAQNPTVWGTPQTNIEGGHDIQAVDYNPDGVVISTWGGTRLIPWPTFTALNNNTELYAHLGADWYNDDQLAPNGLNVSALKTALQQLGGGSVPPLPDPTPPPVPTPPVPTPPVPVPPTPVPPVPVHEPLAITLHGSFPAGLFGGSRDVTITGTATPASGFRLCDQSAAAFSPNWLALVQDGIQITAAVMSKNYAALPALIEKLIADLTAHAAAAPFGKLTPDQWAALIQAILSIIGIFKK